MKTVEILILFLLHYGVDCYNRKLVQQKIRRTIELESSNQRIPLGEFDLVVPENPRVSAISELNSGLKFLAIFPTVYFSLPSIVKAVEQDEYIDNAAGYAIGIFPGWLNMPRKTPTKVTMSQYQSEEVLFVSSNFAEGLSLGISRCNARQLLKDFQVEWWFAPLETFEDVGSPLLIAELLILQRQGDFDRKATATEIIDAKMADDNSLLFSFKTPLAENVNRQTICKAFFRRGNIMATWISGLPIVFEGEYAPQIIKIRDSFRLI